LTAEKYGILVVCSSIACRSARSDIDPENIGANLKRKEAHIMAKKKAAKKTVKKATKKKKK